MSANDTLLVETAPEEIEVDRDEDRRYEWVNGHRVERDMGARASLVAGVLVQQLGVHVRTRRLGWVFVADCGYQIFAHAPKLVRYPDVSFVRTGQFPDGKVPDGYVKVVPDLIVEVISPKDLAEEIQTRLMDFVRVDVPLIWLVYPQSRSVLVIRRGGAATLLRDTDTLAGEDVLPEFTCPVADLFAD